MKKVTFFFIIYKPLLNFNILITDILVYPNKIFFYDKSKKLMNSSIKFINILSNLKNPKILKKSLIKNYN